MKCYKLIGQKSITKAGQGIRVLHTGDTSLILNNLTSPWTNVLSFIVHNVYTFYKMIINYAPFMGVMFSGSFTVNWK